MVAALQIGVDEGGELLFPNGVREHEKKGQKAVTLQKVVRGPEALQALFSEAKELSHSGGGGLTMVFLRPLKTYGWLLGAKQKQEVSSFFQRALSNSPGLQPNTDAIEDDSKNKSLSVRAQSTAGRSGGKAPSAPPTASVSKKDTKSMEKIEEKRNLVMKFFQPRGNSET